METLQLISITLEFIIVVVSLLLAIQKRRVYGWGFAITFAIYVFYDLANLYGWEVNAALLSVSFLAATLSALLAIQMLYKKS